MRREFGLLLLEHKWWSIILYAPILFLVSHSAKGAFIAAAYYLVLLLVVWIISRRYKGLVIDEQGITYDGIGEFDFIAWDNVGQYVGRIYRNRDDEDGGGGSGAAVRYRNGGEDEDIRDGHDIDDTAFHYMFIPKGKIAASDTEIDNAINEGIATMSITSGNPRWKLIWSISGNGRAPGYGFRSHSLCSLSGWPSLAMRPACATALV